ncbi:LamG domain-containing protein [Candidatus Poribacteria bacterium]|nr:LamG domain-containing protein [Candidatus Poribacteria bacterium]
MKYLLGYGALLSLIFVTVGYTVADFTDNLVFYFTFDNVEGKRVLDESENGLDAEVIKNTKFVKGKYGAAIQITRETEDCVNIPATDELKISDAITMMAWVYYEEWTGSSSQWLDKGCYSKGLKSYGMAVFGKKHFPELGALENGSGISLILANDTATHISMVPNEMENRTWHHIVGTYDDKATKIYLDGEVILESPSGFEFSGTNDEDVRIGCAKGEPEYAFEDGFIDEIGLWSRALSEKEIGDAMRSPLFSVSPKDKIATTWGDIKSQR